LELEASLFQSTLGIYFTVWVGVIIHIVCHYETLPAVFSPVQYSTVLKSVCV